MTDSSSYFTRTGVNTFCATQWASGAWSETEQHFSPLGGLIVHAIDQYVAARGIDDGLVIARLSFEILGVVGLEEMDVAVETIRAGHTIELLEATVTWRGRAVVRARAWRLAVIDTTIVAGGVPDALPHPDTLARWNMAGEWRGDYIRSLDVRPVSAPQPGRGAAWLASEIDLVEGEPSSAVAQFVRLADTANGIAVREAPAKWMYPNVDLSIYLYRQPQGRWVGLDATVVFGASGQGVTSTVLHDEHGAIGCAQQLLTVRPVAGSGSGLGLESDSDSDNGTTAEW